MSRMTQLLEAAAERFADHSSPFETEWLSEHNVTLTECMELSEMVGNACKNWARLDTPAKAEAAVRVAFDEPKERTHMLAAMHHVVAMDRVTKELGRRTPKLSKGTP